MPDPLACWLAGLLMGALVCCSCDWLGFRAARHRCAAAEAEFRDKAAKARQLESRAEGLVRLTQELRRGAAADRAAAAADRLLASVAYTEGTP